jgi:hypothetical protein
MKTMDEKMSKTAIELFLGIELETIIEGEDGAYYFVTSDGRSGAMAENFVGNWDIWIDDDVVYCVENELVPLLSHHNDNYLFDLYSYATEIKDIELQERSKMFLDIVIKSIEKILLAGRLPLDGSAIVGINEVIYTNGKKFIIGLN